MHGKLLALLLAVALIGGCAGMSTNPTTPFIPHKSRLVGIWAMIPLRNGIANVAEYRADGKVYLHPFNCASKEEREVEVSDYRVADDGEWINIKSPHDRFDLKVVRFARDAMELTMQVSGIDLTFRYLKVKEVKSFCSVYVPPAEAGSGVAFEPGDFTAAAAIPNHPGRARLLGKWADDKHSVQIEVREEATGAPYLYQADSENWRYRYNDVRWVGDELHFQKFAYTEKPLLFRHPYHKARLASILTPLADGKMQYSYFIGERRHDAVLTRQPQ